MNSSRVPAQGRPSRLFTKTASLSAAIVALLFVCSIATSNAETPVPPDRNALMEKLTKILVYGDTIAASGPSKADAVVALGLLGDHRAVPVLLEHLENSHNRSLRFQIVRALGWLGSLDAVPALETLLQDPDPHMRRITAIALKSLTGREYDYDKTGLPVLRKLIERTCLPSTEQP